MRYLLDTHVFLWLLGQPSAVPTALRTEMGRIENELLVSAASAMEAATKVRLGKLDARNVVDDWSVRVRDLQAEALAVTTEHALRAGSLGWSHRDPFDRLLVAQALIENLTLVTSDAAISAFPGVRVTW